MEKGLLKSREFAKKISATRYFKNNEINSSFASKIETVRAKQKISDFLSELQEKGKAASQLLSPTKTSSFLSPLASHRSNISNKEKYIYVINN